MKCAECADKLDRFLDRELTNTEALEVQLHLEGCPDCMEHYDFESHLKRLVKHSCECDTAPTTLREKLRQILS
ncbi:MAG TPA: mycothiol system anti-sigma-R factor [Verrucomicrobiae bacterium]|nr:mycothiol system anti-sigma-R factor [Verrucomicrobiae bacterium]